MPIDGKITRAYSTGSVSGVESVGGLAEWNSNADGDGNPFSGIDDFWEFGTARGYPVLRADLDGDGVATSPEFGSQLKPEAGPVPESTPVQPVPTPTRPPQRQAAPGS